MLINYLKIAYAVFMRRKFYTFVNLFGITFTLTVLMIATAVLDNIYGGIPPEVNQNRSLAIMNAYAETERNGRIGGTHGAASFELLENHIYDLPGVELVSVTGMIWQVLSYARGQRIESYVRYTDVNFWRILQFDFIEGRPYTQDEFDIAAPVVVINEAMRSKFFGEESATGKNITVGGKRYRVTGVVKNVPLTRLIPYSDIWAPLSIELIRKNFDPYVGTYLGLILAKNKSYFPQIKEEFRSRMRNIDLSGTKYTKVVSVPETTLELSARVLFSQGRSEEAAVYLYVFLIIGAGLLFMILPAVNMVNLNTGRILERASEIGIRKAFGAPTSTLIGQFIVENVLLSLVGGIAGLIFAFLSLDFFSGLGIIPHANFVFNYRIFLYGLIITTFFGVFSGVYPAWRMSRMHPVQALRGGVL